MILGGNKRTTIGSKLHVYRLPSEKENTIELSVAQGKSMEACNPKPKGVIPHTSISSTKFDNFSYLLQKFISNSYKIQLYIRVSRSTAWSNFILLLLKFTSHAFHHCKHSLV